MIEYTGAWRQVCDLYRKRPVTAIIFDSGGTLVRSPVPKAVTFYRLASEVVGVKDAKTLREAFAEGYNHYNRYYLSANDETASRGACLAVWEKLLGPGSEADDMAAVYYNRLQRDAGRAPYPGTIPVLKQLKERYRLAVLSNAPPLLIEEYRKCRLDRYFVAVVSSGDIGVEKPDPAAFQRILHAVARDCSDVVFVGDSLSDDVFGALSCGIRAVWLWRDGVRKSRLEPIPVIQSLAELPGVLQEMMGADE